MGCKLLVGQHWSVCSPEMEIYHQTEVDPPEWGCCWVIVAAANRPQARTAAIHTGEMFPWVDQQRSDSRSPYTGLKVEPVTCGHGTCLGCQDECDECTEQWEKDHPDDL